MIYKNLYLLCFGAILGCLSGCLPESTGKKLPDLKESYIYTDKRPFGTYIAYRQLQEMFYRNTLREEKRNFEEGGRYLEDTASLYICITHTLYSTDDDATALVRFVEKGNDVFISARQFDEYFLDKLDCSVNPINYLEEYSEKPYQNTTIAIKKGLPVDSGRYGYFYFPLSASFSKYKHDNTRVLGLNSSGQPDFIVIFKGKGHVFLHCEPRAFSNYFLLQQNNYQYLEKTFGFPAAYPEHVYWNTYYAKLRSKEQANHQHSDDNSSFSSFSTLLSYPPLAKAFWLTLTLLLLYILFGVKRRQRIIELIKPNENSTVTFTETIGRLYLQKKDNKNITDKMITYFNEYIRNNYFLNTNLINDDFVTTLSRKSGVPREKIDSLYRAIAYSQNHQVIDDFQLMSLNEQVKDFFKRIQ